ncbi:MAG: hypothetical protein WC635_04485 [Bacteriovorax sp.]|jgi:hypothetical protein
MGKNLKDIFSLYPHVTLATHAENDELLAFYHKTELSAESNSVIYQRGSDFFKFLQERSDHFMVFALRDDEKMLKGLGVLSFRPGYINGVLTTIGYLGDLRISMNRKLIREWRQFYGALIHYSPELPETEYCRYFQTAIIAANRYSKNNLVETKIPNLAYSEFAPYKMINIVGLWSLKKTVPSHVRWADVNDRNALISFLNEDHQKRFFGIDWEQEFDRRLKTWSHFSIQDYFIVHDSRDRNKILAAGSVWNPIESKQILVPRIPAFIRFLSQIASAVPGFLVKPAPIAMKPIEILYLNQISFAPGLVFKEKRKILKSIIQMIFSRNFERDFNMLAYCDFERDNLLANANYLVSQKMPMGLFTVHHKDKNGIIRDEINLKEKNLSPAFDIALV